MFHSFKFAFFLGLSDIAMEGFSDFVPFNSFARFLEKKKKKLYVSVYRKNSRVRQ
jgi:hypothetical protein